jgi:hypothetical protein
MSDLMRWYRPVTTNRTSGPEPISVPTASGSPVCEAEHASRVGRVNRRPGSAASSARASTASMGMSQIRRPAGREAASTPDQISCLTRPSVIPSRAAAAATVMWPGVGERVGPEPRSGQMSPVDQARDPHSSASATVDATSASAEVGPRTGSVSSWALGCGRSVSVEVTARSARGATTSRRCSRLDYPRSRSGRERPSTSRPGEREPVRRREPGSPRTAASPRRPPQG